MFADETSILENAESDLNLPDHLNKVIDWFSYNEPNVNTSN